MANTLVTPTIISQQVLSHTRNNLSFSKNVDRQISREFKKVGNSVDVRKPVKFIAKDGATRIGQDVEEATTSVTLDQRKHISWSFETVDLTLSVKDFDQRYSLPAGLELANVCDEVGCGQYIYVPQAVHDGTVPTTFLEFGATAQRLNEAGVPMDRRNLILNPEAELNAANMLKGTQTEALTPGAVRGMTTGVIAGQQLYMDQNIKSHVESTDWGASAQVDGANQDVTYANASHTFGPLSQTLSVKGLGSASGTLKAGDKFTLAGVNAINPKSRADLGYAQVFTVVEDVAYTSSTADVKIAPAIITSGAYQTVTAAPADSANITMEGDYIANIGYQRGAFVLATAPLILPDGANFKARATYDNMSIRVLKSYDIDNDEDVIRMDILFGWKFVNWPFAVILKG